MPAAPMQVFLDRLHAEYHRRSYLSSDPLEFVHRYQDPMDQEVVALVSALLAYGNVKQIRRSVELLLGRISTVAHSPSEFVRRLSEPHFLVSARSALKGFVHRFNRDEDLLVLLRLLNLSWSEHGSLGAHFVSYLAPEAPDFALALSAFVTEWRAWARTRFKVSRDSSFHYLLTSPADGSCCKRWCMFLRWMGRDDRMTEFLDVGLWTKNGTLAHTFQPGKYLDSKQLIIPLDTHTGRISQYLGLTRRKTMDWKAALEVTAALRLSDRQDPVKYDFALARLGILDLCQRKYRVEICTRCPLVECCRYAQKKIRRTQGPHIERKSASLL